jgi:tryptophan synthase alpha chain
MNNRIDRLFTEKDRKILSIYLTAGYPGLQDMPALLDTLQDCGADMVEIGIPFSDPLADGPVIQQSSQQALQNGMTLDLLFRQLEKVRERVSIPLVLMGYLNPVLQMGMERFLGRCRDTGIDGVILPDLPPAEYEAEYLDQFRTYGIYHILLVTPQSGEERIRKIAALSEGFLYLVAAASTTGAKKTLGANQENYFRRIRDLELPLPGLIGFGISNRETFLAACRYARGAIIGSAFIQALGADHTLTLEQRVRSFIGEIRGDVTHET